MFLARYLSLELSGRQRQATRPGPVVLLYCHRPEPGGLPLALRLSEGLGFSDALSLEDFSDFLKGCAYSTQWKWNI